MAFKHVIFNVSDREASRLGVISLGMLRTNVRGSGTNANIQTVTTMLRQYIVWNVQYSILLYQDLTYVKSETRP